MHNEWRLSGKLEVSSVPLCKALHKGTYAKSSIMESSKSKHAPGADGQRQAQILIVT
jgi:hypothetical protein